MAIPASKTWDEFIAEQEEESGEAYSDEVKACYVDLGSNDAFHY